MQEQRPSVGIDPVVLVLGRTLQARAIQPRSGIDEEVRWSGQDGCFHQIWELHRTSRSFSHIGR